MSDEDSRLLHRPSAARDVDPAPRTAASGGLPTSRWLLGLMALGLAAASLNLRTAIAGLGPLLEEVRAGYGMNNTVAGLLTALPALCFAVVGLFGPRLARRFGPATVILGGITAIALGLLLRPFAQDTPTFLAASALSLAGIAVGNVLMPVVVKHWFPHRVGTMTGLYSMGMAIGTSGAAALTVPLTEALGGSWRVGLGVWAVPAVLAVPLWGAVLWYAAPRRSAPAPSARSAPEGRHVDPDPRSGPNPTGERAAAAPPPRMSRNPTAWALAGFFGLQATAAYVIMGWMPQIFRDAGVPATTAGLLLAVTMGLSIPLSFAIPPLAARLRHQGPLVVMLGTCGFAGYLGLWLAPAGGAWAWALLLGVANCAFPLALTLIGLRSRSGAGVARLSAFAQSTGYLISLPGPLVVGALYEHSGGWRVPLIIMMALLAVQTTLGVLVGRNRCVEDTR